jgi:pseudaminic acid synthase
MEKIKGFKLNNNRLPLFIAEISANHLGNFDRAEELVNAAITSGASAVKFQTYTAETMTIDSDFEEFKIDPTHKLWGGRKLFELYQEAYTPWEWHEELFNMCRERNVIPFSSPFDSTAVDFLESIDAPMYKIASMETGDHNLIRRVAETGKPIIISTGATELEEIDELVEVVRKTGNSNLTLLVCTSSYPAKPADAHIFRMKMLRDRFGVKIGLSDHTLGIGVSIAAIALGAVAIEKHITISRNDGGPDGAFSMEPHEFKQMVEEGTSAALSLGSENWSMQASEKESRRIRRSLYVVKDVKAGEIVSKENIRAIRPGGGAKPKNYAAFIGKKFKKDLGAGTPMHENLID